MGEGWKLDHARAMKSPPDEKGHRWFQFHGMDSCAMCGIVRLRDPSKQSKCKGVVRIALRGTQAPKTEE